MGMYSLGLLTKKLIESGVSLATSKTLKDILEIENERTYYRVVKDLVKDNILVNIEKNKYLITGKDVSTFEMANFLYQPSYISLETALNFWGILSQFPYEITSVTLKKSAVKKFEGKVYSYSKISSRYYGFFVKKDKALIALPEKALFDQLYLASKGLRTVNFDEYDLENVNIKKLLGICSELKANKNIMSLVGRIIG